MAPRGFDCFMVHTKIAGHRTMAALTVSEKWCYVAGILALAGESPIRGTLLVTEDRRADELEVAHQAHVTIAVARATLRKAAEAGLIVEDDELECWRVRDWDQYNPKPKTDRTAAERQQRRRDKLKSNRDVTAASRRDARNDHATVTPPEVEGEGEATTARDETTFRDPLETRSGITVVRGAAA